MNERIKLLADQAELTIRTSIGTYMSHPEFNQNFAKLIIKECISIAQDRAAFDWAAPNDVNHIISEIKEHFGVEE